MMPRLLSLAFLFLSSAAVAEPFTVVELFTSKYCPSCPAVESYLKEKAATDTSLLIVMENVDYWDRPPTQIDPHGNPDFTQRQYDYSNLLADRPGKVFTPQPVINGLEVAEPPMFLNWTDALKKGQAQPPASITLSTTSTGGLIVSLPKGMKVDASHELYLLGMEQEEGHTLWRGKGVIAISGQGDTLAVAKNQLPKGTHILALLQLTGPGRVVAAGHIQRK